MDFRLSINIVVLVDISWCVQSEFFMGGKHKTVHFIWCFMAAYSNAFNNDIITFR